MKFIHITDTHVMPRGEMLYGLDPEARLRACIADINRNHADAEFAVVSGDLTHHGHLEAYHVVRDCFAELTIPWHPMLGNHDKRPGFFEVFPDAPRDANGFVQYSFEAGGITFVCLDSHDPGGPWGTLCDQRLDWLRQELDRIGDKPVYLFVHHPPFRVGIKRMDRNSLREPERLQAVLAGRRNIRHLFYGHLHRPIAGSWHGIPFSTMRGTNHQVALNFEIDGVVPGSREPPAYAVVFADPELTVVHFHDYLDQTADFHL
jgi:3',5'-cyclic-AMP phosphodiesterase